MDGRTEGRTDGRTDRSLMLTYFIGPILQIFFDLENQNLFQSLNLTDSCIEGA